MAQGETGAGREAECSADLGAWRPKARTVGPAEQGWGTPQAFDESQEDSEVVRTVCGVWARMRAPSSQHIGSGNRVEQAGRRHVGGARDLSQIHSSPEDLERGLRTERLTHLLDSQWASASYRQPPRHSTDSPGVLAMANGDWQQRVIGLLFLLYKTHSRIMAATLFSTRDGPDIC